MCFDFVSVKKEKYFYISVQKELFFLKKSFLGLVFNGKV